MSMFNSKDYENNGILKVFHSILEILKCVQIPPLYLVKLLDNNWFTAEIISLYWYAIC